MKHASIKATGSSNGSAKLLQQLAVAAMLGSLSACGHAPATPGGAPLTTAEQVRHVTADAVAGQIPVHLRGTATYVDGTLGIFFMQDNSGAVQLEGQMGGVGVGPGDSLEVDGVVAGGESNPTVTISRIRAPSRGGPLPIPARPSASELVSGEFQYRYVEIEGLVKSAFLDHAGKVGLIVRALGRDIEIKVRDQSPLDYDSLVDATISVRGDLGVSFDTSAVPIGVKLWVAFIDDVKVLKPAPAGAGVPLQTVRSVLAFDHRSLPEHRVRLRGIVSSDAGKLTLRDSTGSIALRPARAENIGTGGPTDILGFASEERGSLAMTECTVVGEAAKRHSAAPLPVLTTVAQVKDLPEDRAKLAYPVRLRALVTYYSPLDAIAFLQDKTAGIFVFFLSGGGQPGLEAGQLVEIEGSSRAGNFAPIIAMTGARIVGRQPLPEPARMDLDQLFSGIADSDWVEAEGVVHSIRQQGGHTVLGLDWGTHHFEAYLPGAAKLPDSLLDSRIRLRGVCGSLFNFKRQILGIHLFVPDAGQIEIVASGDARTLPLQNIEQLMQFTSSSHFGERSRIRGVVTLADPGGPTYVSDSTGGVLIQGHPPAGLEVGDAVEAVGFPVAVAGAFNPVLRDAEVQELGHGEAPDPMLVTAKDILEEGFDAQLVQLDAVLVDQGAVRGKQALVLQAGDRLFDARIEKQGLPPLERGSLLRVTGITSIQAFEDSGLPQTFSIVLRSPADIVVLRQAPWWTATRAFGLLGLVLVVALLAFAWIVVLRRQVREHTSDLRRSRQMLQLVLDHLPQRVFWKDIGGHFLGCNNALVAQAGVPSPQDILGKTDYDFNWKATADRYVADDRQVIESGVAKIGYEEPQIGPDGSQRWVRTSKVPLPGSVGGVIGVLGISEDITETKRTAELLERYSAELAETNEELRRFTNIVSHDLRAPLVNLKGFSVDLRSSIDTVHKSEEAMLANLEEPERSAVAEALREIIPEDLGFIESSVTRMDHLTGTLLQLSRAGHRELHMEELDAGALVQGIVASLAHQIQSHNIAVEIGPLPRITSDRAAIEQIFGNLLDNATKYLDPDRPARIEVSAVETADAIVFRVRDTGRGIAEHDMDKVFAPFRRAGAQDVPGEGMGLAFVKALLHRLGGRIECRSQPGAGTTFSFTLPRLGEKQ